MGRRLHADTGGRGGPSPLALPGQGTRRAALVEGFRFLDGIVRARAAPDKECREAAEEAARGIARLRPPRRAWNRRGSGDQAMRLLTTCARFSPFSVKL